MNQKIISIYAVIVTIVILLQLCTRKDRITVPEDVVNWWASGLSRDKWLANKLQYKLVFSSETER